MRQSVVEGNFKLVYSHSLEGYARRAIHLLRDAVPGYEQEFRIRLSGRYELDIVKSREEYSEFTAKKIPAWSQAVFISGERRILVLTVARDALPGGFEGSLRHELVHLFLSARGVAEKIPLWLNEGLAQRLSGAKIGVAEGTRVGNAIFAGTIISLSGIDSLQDFNGSRASLAYHQSLLAVQFLEKRMHDKNIDWQTLLSDISGIGYQNAFQKNLGFQPVDFEFKYYRWMQKKYKWFIMFNLENLMWLAMLIVLAGAYYAIRYKNARRLREWELAEARYQQLIQEFPQMVDSIDETEGE